MHPILTQALLIDKGYIAGEYRLPHGPMQNCLRRFPWLSKYFRLSDLAQICPQHVRSEFVDFTPMKGEKVCLLDGKGDIVCFSLNDAFFLWKLGVTWLSSFRIEGEFEPGESLRSALGRFSFSRQKIQYVLSYSPKTQAVIVYYPPPNHSMTTWLMEKTKVTAWERAEQARLNLRLAIERYRFWRKRRSVIPA